MSEEEPQIRTERDFVIFLNQLAGKLLEGDLTHASADLSESLCGMSEYLDNHDSETPRDGLKWDMIAAMILAGVKKTKSYQEDVKSSDG